MSSEAGAPRPPGVIPLSVPELSGNEWTYVKECLDTGWVSSAGPFVRRFEEQIAARIGARYAVATTSGTAALHLAILALGITPDDMVVTSALSFVAPANAIKYTGAAPAFIDADPVYWQLDVGKLERFIRSECVASHGTLSHRGSGRRVVGILPVHILGHPCEMRPIRDLAARYGLWVLEDATESLGATYEGVPVGHLGEAACLSFNGNKLITTGGGGMVVTDDARVADRARYLSTQAKDDPVEYVHGAIGFNYRLSNVQAAIGVAQLERLDRFIAVKRAIAERYAAGLGHVDGLVLPNEAPWARSAFWLYTVLVREEEFGMSSRELLACLQRAGIDSRPLWRPLPRLGHLDDHPAVGVEVADRLHAEALSLPSSVGLDAERQRCVIDTIIEASGGRR